MKCTITSSALFSEVNSVTRHRNTKEEVVNMIMTIKRTLAQNIIEYARPVAEL